MADEAKVAGLLLAAGESSRMGTLKALLPVGNETFAGRIYRVLNEAGLEPVTVVLGYRSDDIASGAGIPAGVIAHNVNYREGMLSSLKVGISHLLKTDAGAFVLSLVDGPDVSGAVVRELVATFRRTGAPVVEPSFRGQHGHPVLLARQIWQEILDADPETGAKLVVRRHRPAGIQVEVDDPSILIDLDTPEEFAAWAATQRTEASPQ